MQTERIVWPSVARGNQEQDANRELGGEGPVGRGGTNLIVIQFQRQKIMVIIILKIEGGREENNNNKKRNSWVFVF